MHRAIAAALLTFTAAAQEKPARPAFDVADIVPAKDTTVPPRGEFRNSRINGFNVPMRLMFRVAWDLQDDKMLVGAPAWFDSDHFDVIAKAPPETQDTTLKLMLQNLIIERFKLAYHTEDKVVQVYILSVKKDGPKLQPGTSGKRTACTNIPATDGNGHRECVNVTMADFATMLPGMASAYVDLPVYDATGLKGSFDFNLTWAPRARIENPELGGSGNSLTVFEALDRQVGLKLEPGKHAMPVMVIDHIDRTPTQN